MYNLSLSYLVLLVLLVPSAPITQAFVLFLDYTFHFLHRAVFLPTACPMSFYFLLSRSHLKHYPPGENFLTTWRRQFPPREVHGISMMPGSSETLPAGFRLTTTSGQSRKMTTDGIVVFPFCL